MTGFIRGSLDFYNITPSSLESTNIPWKSHAQSLMSDTNITELSDKLGSWNWSVATNLSWSVVDHAPVVVEGVSERIAMIHVRCLHEPFQPTHSEKVIFREGLILWIPHVRMRCDWSLMVFTSSRTVPFMGLLNRTGEAHFVVDLAFPCSPLVTISRDIDIRYLPVIVPESIRNETARVIQPELLSRINKVKEMIDAGVAEQESPQGL